MNYGICRNEEEAVAWVKRNKKFIKEKFASIKDYPPDNYPSTIFMAGAPGVGKTEFSKLFIENTFGKEQKEKFVMVDTDEIRLIIPGYTGYNAPEFQRAASLGVEYVIDSAYENKQNMCVDTTFGLTSKAISNVNRAINRGRNCLVLYLYQDPVLSWEYVKERKIAEKREVPKIFFINNLLLSEFNANLVKRTFGSKVVLVLFLFDDNHKVTSAYFDIDNTKRYVKIPYSREKLEEILKNG